MAMERLQKVLARAGIASRRAAEKIIDAGRVTVNGVVVREMGSKVDARRATVAVDGDAIHFEKSVHILLYKPRGVVTTSRDPEGRATVLDLVRVRERVFPVGRLDAESEGLLLLTNDGPLAQALTHPSRGVLRVYEVQVAGRVETELVKELEKGVWLSEGKARASSVKIGRLSNNLSTLTVSLTEGKNREVRRILAKVGLSVKRLVRTRIGPLRLGGLKPGAWRRLTKSELEVLREIAMRPGPRPADDRGARRDGKPRGGTGRPKPPKKSSPPKPPGAPREVVVKEEEE